MASDDHGNFIVAPIAFDAPLGVTEWDQATPIECSALAAFLEVAGSEANDKIGLDVNPETEVGTLDAAVSAGDKVIKVPPSVIDLVRNGQVYPGQMLHLGDAPTLDNMGIIKQIDQPTRLIHACIGATSAHTAGENVRVTTSMTLPFFTSDVDEIGWLELGANAEEMKFGVERRGTTPFPRGTVVRIRYDNAGAIPTKRVRGRLEVVLT
jgi:hypothetical protein